MAKRRAGNPNWGKGKPIGAMAATVTEFEQVVKKLMLRPDEYVRSIRLRKWARKKKDSRYIPEPLLQAWGFEIDRAL
jgi:hypothetical protein